MSSDSNMKMLISQFNDLKYKDYLKIYLYTLMRIIFENPCKAAFLTVILDNWLALIDQAPQNRPDVGPLHSMAFLIKYIENLQEKVN